MSTEDKATTPAEALIDIQAQAAYETFMTITYGPNKTEKWASLPEYARVGWRHVILNQTIATYLDTKYRLQMLNGRPRIVNKTSGLAIPEDEPVMVFRARDRNALAMLRRYRELCKLDGCAVEHMAGIEACIKLFGTFAKERPLLMKRPGDLNNEPKP